MSFVSEFKYLIRLIVLVGTLGLIILSVVGIFLGFVNMALLAPLKIVLCVLFGYALAMVGTRILFPVPND